MSAPYSSQPEGADLDPKHVPDETDSPDYPDSVEYTGTPRDEEPDLDEPIER